MQSTMWVKDKATGEKIKIKSNRFNGEIHETLDEPLKTPEQNTGTPYDAFTRNQLMQECKEKGIKVLITFTKEDLLQKLIEYDTSIKSQEA